MKQNILFHICIRNKWVPKEKTVIECEIMGNEKFWFWEPNVDGLLKGQRHAKGTSIVGAPGGGCTGWAVRGPRKGFHKTSKLFYTHEGSISHMSWSTSHWNGKHVLWWIKTRSTLFIFFIHSIPLPFPLTEQKKPCIICQYNSFVVERASLVGFSGSW